MARHTNLRFTLAAALTLAFVFAAPSPAHGWNRTGHSVIAYIAHKRLNDKTRKQIDDLLREHFISYKVNYKVKSPPKSLSTTDSLNLFTRASWWADDIRADRMYTDKGEDAEGCGYPDGRIDMRIHRNWHFIDYLYFPDSTAPPKVPSEPNLLTVTKCLRQALNDPAVPRSRKAYALVWLIHLVGDAHQPLHCATRVDMQSSSIGDAGGNLFQVSYKGQPMSLHTYWDALLGTSTTSSYVKKAVDSITPKPPSQRQIRTELGLPEGTPVLSALVVGGASDLSEDNWVARSFDLAKSVAYTIGPDSERGKRTVVSRSYNAEAERVASRQALLAGYRLANLLNKVFE